MYPALKCSTCDRSDVYALLKPDNICFVCLMKNKNHPCITCQNDVVLHNQITCNSSPKSSVVADECMTCINRRNTGLCGSCNEIKVLKVDGKCELCSLPNPRHCIRCTKHRKMNEDGLCMKCIDKVKKAAKQNRVK